jgi:hypothetical protein
MVANLEEAGHTVDIDKAALARLTAYWQRVALAEGLPPGAPQNFDASFLRHQIAGGVMTTTARQLAELGLADRLDAVIAETGQVRAELGYPIMVTPFPQMVMSQALFNVIGTRRYAQVSDQVIRYCLGKFGKPTSPIDPAVLATIMDRPRARELEAEPTFPALADLRRQFGHGLPDEEFLLRAVMPGDQVDAMLAAGPRAPPIRPKRRRCSPVAPAGRAARRPRPGGRTPGLSPCPSCRSQPVTIISRPCRAAARCRRFRVRHGRHDCPGRCQERRPQGPAPCRGPAGNAGAARHPLRGFTNGTAKAPADYAASLRAAGFPVSDAQMLTPSASAAAWFVAQGMRRVRVLGNAGCAAPLRAAGLEVIDPAAPAQDVEAVYTGWFREFDFAALEAACDSLWHGARLFTASNVPFFATATGRAIGSSFAINAMLTAMTGKRARILGKPSRVAFDVARQIMGLPAARCGRWSWWATIRPWKCAWPMPPARSPWG